MKQSKKTRKAVCPFKLDRASRDSLTDQLANGLRDAIHSRFYKADDALPPMPELAGFLGVSEITVRAAYRKLAEDGLVIARPRRGTVVLPSKSPVWRGHVLCVMCDHDFNYQLAAGVENTRMLLTKNGFLFSQVTVLEELDGTTDFSGLDVALSRPVDFIILFNDVPCVANRISASGVPFVVVGGMGDVPPGCVGRVGKSFRRALDERVRHCRQMKVGMAEIVSCSRFDKLELSAAKALWKEGIDVKRTIVPHDAWVNRCESAMRAGYDFVARSIGRHGFHFPDLYFATDDWVAAGMLSAFQANGVKIPEDVRFVGYSNRGFGPVYSKSIAVLSADTFANGKEIARRIYDHLVLRKPFPNSHIEYEYLPGDTFPSDW